MLSDSPPSRSPTPWRDLVWTCGLGACMRINYGLPLLPLFPMISMLPLLHCSIVSVHPLIDIMCRFTITGSRPELHIRMFGCMAFRLTLATALFTEAHMLLTQNVRKADGAMQFANLARTKLTSHCDKSRHRTKDMAPVSFDLC
jgi:hypothetical protein